MASIAVPMIFPPQAIGNEYFGDGAMRQATPLSPAVHLGAALGLAALASFIAVPAGQALAIAFLASLVRPAAYTLAGILVDPNPVRAALAFAYLPFYTVWRLGVAFRSLSLVRSDEWVRTERHATNKDRRVPDA